MGVVVGGVILDESVLLASNSPQHENPSLQPVADSLLRKLRHSKIPTQISYDVGLSDDKVSLLKRLATLYSFDYFILNASSVDDAKNEIMLAWGDTGGSILYVVSDKKKEFFPKLSNCSWLIVVVRSLGQESADVTEGGSACENSSMIFVNKLEELPSTIRHINRKRGAFPLYPTQNGLIFMPFAFELPLSPQLQEVDMVLHKATDEIVSIELKSSTNFYNRIVCTCGMRDLQSHRLLYSAANCDGNLVLSKVDQTGLPCYVGYWTQRPNKSFLSLQLPSHLDLDEPNCPYPRLFGSPSLSPTQEKFLSWARILHHGLVPIKKENKPEKD